MDIKVKRLEKLYNDALKIYDMENGIFVSGFSAAIRETIEFDDDIANTPLEWSILHTFLHNETISPSEGTFYSTLISLLSEIYDRYNFVAIPELINKLKVNPNLINEFDNAFWNYVPYGKVHTSQLFIKSKMLINPLRKLYLYKVDKKGFKNEFEYLSQCNMRINTTYEVNDQVVHFNNNLKRLLVIEANDLSTAYYEKLNIFFGHQLFNKDEIAVLVNRKKESVFYEEINIMEKLDKLMKSKNKSWDYKTKLFAYGNKTRILPAFLSLMTVADFSKLKQMNIDELIIKNYSWSIDPYSNRPYHYSLTSFHLKQLYIFLKKHKLATNRSEFDVYIKQKCASGNDLFYKYKRETDEFIKSFKFDDASSDFTSKNGNTAILMKTKDFEISCPKNNWNFFEKASSFFKKSISLYDKQNIFKGDLQALTTHKSLVLMGPAGHGKTTLVMELIKDKCYLDVLIVTPTWRASTAYSPLKGFPITYKTIQAITQSKNNDFLKYDLLIFDEISMYSIENWEQIFNIDFKDSAKIIFLGDDKQIPPIGSNDLSHVIKFLAEKNKVLFDMEKLPNRRIENSQYNKEISELLSNLRKDKFDINRSSYVKFISVYSNLSDAHEEIKNICQQIKNHDTTFILEKNIGFLGTKLLNKTYLGSNEDDTYIFKEGMTVILTDNIDKTMGFYNNTEATIKKIDVLRNGLYSYHLESNGKNIYINRQRGDEEFEPVLFITAHKAQGTTIKNIVVVIESKIVDPKWLYTACSRVSKNIQILIPQNFQGLALKETTDNYKYVYEKEKEIDDCMMEELLSDL